MTISALITFVTTLIGNMGSGETPGSGLLGWAQQFVNFITANPVILVFVVTPLLFWAIGAIRRLLRL